MAEIVSLAEAIAAAVRDGDTVAMEGFTHLIPHAAGHEVIRQRRRELTLVRMTPDIIYDQLIGAGCARKLIFSWAGNPGVGSLHRFRDAVERGWPGPLELEEHSHAGMANRYQAGASGLPFAILRGYRGTSLGEHTAGVADITCPFTGETLTAVSALRPDVAVVHAQQADRRGNVQFWGITGVQKEAVLAAARSVVTVEEIVDSLPPTPGAVVLPAWAVSYVAAAPGGAHPSYALGYSARDNGFYRGLGRDQPGPGEVRCLAERARLRPGGRAMSEPTGNYSPDEMMAVTAARSLRDGMTCFVGIGLPSEAANLARAVHAPNLVLIYESGTIGAKPARCRCRSATASSPRPRTPSSACRRSSTTGCSRAASTSASSARAQLDRYGNINTTVVGDSYDHPVVRLPGAGGAPEIAAACKEVIVVLRQSRRTFAQRLDFVTSVGYGDGPGSRERLGLTGGGPRQVITDLGVLRPDPDTLELVLTELYPGVSVAQVQEKTGWDLRVSPELAQARAAGGARARRAARVASERPREPAEGART